HSSHLRSRHIVCNQQDKGLLYSILGALVSIGRIFAPRNQKRS
ncbi:MAG: hypothetical protein ACI974_001116, partial [Paraglaciecola sp.]